MHLGSGCRGDFVRCVLEPLVALTDELQRARAERWGSQYWLYAVVARVMINPVKVDGPSRCRKESRWRVSGSRGRHIFRLKVVL